MGFLLSIENVVHQWYREFFVIVNVSIAIIFMLR